MGRADTKERCRVCGVRAMSSVYIKHPGLIERVVLCEQHKKEYRNGQIEVLPPLG